MGAAVSPRVVGERWHGPAAPQVQESCGAGAGGVWANARGEHRPGAGGECVQPPALAASHVSTRVRGMYCLLHMLQMPGHAAAWQYAHPGLAACGPQPERVEHPSPSGESYAGCAEGKGNLDPTNATLFSVIHAILQEFRDLFPAPLVHVGGEEVHWGCWANQRIVAWAQEHARGKKGNDTGACEYNRPCAHQDVGKSQSCML